MVPECPHFCRGVLCLPNDSWVQSGGSHRVGNQDQDLLLNQGTSLSGQSVRQWELRLMGQVAASKEVATSKLRRLLA